MYDLDGDDKISKEELLAVLTMMVGANISQDQLDSIAERTVMEADADQVGKTFYIRRLHDILGVQPVLPESLVKE